MQTSGRPGLSYDDVADAADRLVGRGERPTLRALREEIGKGSMAVIQRHLATWRSKQTRVRAASPFDISPGDVAGLSPLDFAALANHLVRLEAKTNQLDATPSTTLNINVADGGVDGMISWDGGAERTSRLPARTVVWQVKSGRRLSPSELVREITRRDGTDLKPRLRELFLNGGAYILFSAADMPAEAKAIRLSAMSDTIRRLLPDCEPKLRILGAEEIAAWAAEDLWARTFLIRAAGRSHPATLLTFDEWQRDSDFSHPYVWSDEANAIAVAMRDFLLHNGGAYRLDGAPGLGKTRLTLEALRPLAAEGLGVVYIDVRHAGNDIELLRSLPNWRRFDVHGTIVVDNCNLDLHQQLSKAIENSPLNVVTIASYAGSGGDKTLQRVSSELIQQIVTSYQPRLAPEQALAVVRYAEGWPLMAILVVRALLRGRDHYANLDDDVLTKRLLENAREPEAERVLAVLSLFDHVGYAGNVEDEWETLRSAFVPDISRERFYRSVRFYERKGLVSAIGRYWRVSPPPLAIRLTREWLDNALPESKEALFSLRTDLLQSLARRLSHISTPTAVSLADSLLAPGKRFGTLDGILGYNNATIFGALAEVSPGSAVEALERELLPLSDAELRGINDRAGRQSLVFALERIGFHRAHYGAASRVLFALARNETATNSNNSQGVLVKFFAVWGSQTEAAPTARLEILDEILSRDDTVSIDLAARAIARILASDAGYNFLGVELQGGRSPMSAWRGETWGDVFSYYTAAIDRLLLLANKGPEALIRAKEVMADAIVTLVKFARWDDLERGIAALRGGAWPKAQERASWSIRHQLAEAPEADRQRAQDIFDSLEPEDIEERTLLFVSKPPFEFKEQNGHHVDLSIEKVYHFAQETLDSGDFPHVLSVISTGTNHRLPHAYGEALATLAPDVDLVVEQTLEAFANASTPRNALPLVGVILGVHKRNQDRRANILNRLATDGWLVEALPLATTQPRATTDDIWRLIRVYESGALDQPPQSNTFVGRSLANVDEDAIRALAEAFLARQWYGPTAAALLFGVTDSGRFDDIFARLILDSDFVTKEIPDIHEWSLFQIAARLINAGNTHFALALAKQMMVIDPTESSLSLDRRGEELWPLLLTHSEVWNALRERYATLDEHDRWRLLIELEYTPEHEIERRSALEVLPLPDLLAFAAEHIEDVPVFLAQNGRLVRSEDGLSAKARGLAGLRTSELMEALLEHFGNREDVLRAIESKLHSFASVGPVAPYYSRLIEFVDNIPAFENPKIQAWKHRLRASFDEQRRHAQLRDEEISGGIF